MKATWQFFGVVVLMGLWTACSDPGLSTYRIDAHPDLSSTDRAPEAEVDDPGWLPPLTPEVPGAWHIETLVDLDDEAVTSLSMAQQDDDLHIAYVADGHLHYLSNQSGEWVDEDLDYAGGRSGQHVDMTIEPEGTIHIVYWRGGAVHYAWGRQGNWSLEKVLQLSQSTYPYVSIALDGDRVPHVAYRYSERLWLAQRTSDAWALMEAPEVLLRSGKSVALGVEPGGTIRMTFQAHAIYRTDVMPMEGLFETRGLTLRDGRWGSSLVQALDQGFEPASYGSPTSLSMALDRQSRAHVAFRQPSGSEGQGDLQYALETGDAWQVEAIDASGDAGWFVSVALDSAEAVHVSHHEANEGVLLHTTNASGVWQTETVDDDGPTGLHTGIVLESTDTVHIAYFSAGGAALRLASRPVE